MRRGLVVLLALLALASTRQAQAGFFIGDADDHVEVRGWVRAFYNYRFDTPAGEREKNRFALDQARIGLRGKVLGDFAFEFEVGLDDDDAEAKDFWAAYAPGDWLQVRMGQMKTPYSRGRMTPKRYGLFTKRAEVCHDFVPGRDVGILGASRLWRDRVELYGGVFTGNGPNRLEDDGKGKPLVVARLGLAPFGRFRYREGDLERTPRPRLALGINAAWSDDGTLDPEGYLRTIEGEKFLYGADIAFKYRGFFAQAEVNHANLRPDHGLEFRAGGFAVMAAYLALPPWVEVAVRYDEFNPTDRVRGNTRRTITYGLNGYLRGNRAKVQLNYFQRLETDQTHEKWKEDEIRLLFQLVI